jgi:hypothetical protein
VKYLLPIIIVFLASCDGGSDTSRVVENKTEKSIKMLLFNKGLQRGDTLVLDPGERQQVSIESDNDTSGDEPDCADRIDSAQTFIEGGGQLIKLIQWDRNWEVETEKVKNIPVRYEHTCVFIIRPADIEE